MLLTLARDKDEAPRDRLRNAYAFMWDGENQVRRRGDLLGRDSTVHLTKTLRRLEAMGLIERSGLNIRIINAERLRTFAFTTPPVYDPTMSDTPTTPDPLDPDAPADPDAPDDPDPGR